MRLENHGQLYAYLRSLSEILTKHGCSELGYAVAAASDTAWGIPVTEFLGESRIALRRVQSEASHILGREQLKELIDILRQLDEAMNKHLK